MDTQCFVLACSCARPTDGEIYPNHGHSHVVDSQHGSSAGITSIA